MSRKVILPCPCCGKTGPGSPAYGTGQIKCCVCFTPFNVDPSATRPPLLFITLTNLCMPSSPLTFEIDAQPLWGGCEDYDDNGAYFGSVNSGEVQESASAPSCANPLISITILGGYTYSADARLHCIDCDGVPKWMVRWRWLDLSGGIYRIIESTSLLPNEDHAFWKGTLLNVSSCSPFALANSITTICSNEVLADPCCLDSWPTPNVPLYCRAETLTTTCNGSTTGIVISEP